MRRWWSLAVVAVSIGVSCQGTPAHRVSTAPATAASTSPAPPEVLSTPTASPPVPASAPAATPATPVPPGATDLTLTGALSGEVRSAPAVGLCGRAPAGYAATLQFSTGGSSYVLSIALLDYRGPGAYSVPPERVDVHSAPPAASPRFLPAVSGSVTVDQGEASGTVDVTLDDGRTRVRGRWTC